MDPSRLDPANTRIDPEAFVAQGSVVLGDVEVGPDASVWFGVVVRGDMAPIRIAARTNIQDGTVVHVDEGCPAILEEGVTVGHACVIHGCHVGAGSLVTEGKVFPPRSLILGRPAKVVRTLSDADIENLRHSTQHYVDSGRVYRQAGLDARSQG